MSEPCIQAKINYHNRKEAEAHGRAILDLNDFKNTTFVLDTKSVPIRDGRRAAHPPALAEAGFALLDAPTAVKNFYDDKEVQAIYHAETKRVLKQLLGATQVLLFGDVLRSDDPANLKRGMDGVPLRAQTRAGPAPGVHIDFNESAVREYVEALAPQGEAPRRLGKRFANINVWRPITPVERMPLGLCEASSVRGEDLIPCETRAPVGPDGIAPKDGYNLAYNPAHRWWYFPAMQPNEVLVFTIFDSARPHTAMTPHAAFEDPTSAPGARPRESYETRALCFFD